MSHNVKTVCPLWVVTFLNCFKLKYIVFVQGFPRLACLPVGSLGPNQFCWGSLLYCCCPHRTSAHTHTHTHTRTCLINGWAPLPRARGVGAGRFIWYIMAARSALLHWTLSNTCSPIRGCCVGVAWLCHCTDWHCPVGAAERMKYEIPSDKM